jgi:hypothetical protein
MCTVTWRFTPEVGGWGLDLGFNRDERRSRPRARPPRLHVSDEGLPFIAPRDPVGGGTWLSLNAAGLCLGLLNLYEAEGESPYPPKSCFSRGQVIWRLAGRPDAAGVDEGVRRILERERPQPFQLLLLQGGASRQARVWRWDDGALTQQDLPTTTTLLSSSSYRPAEVVSARRSLHAAAAGPTGLAPVAMARFHRGHAPRRGPWSVCMHRADARTVSYSQLRADRTELSYRYAAGAPCRATLGPALLLDPRG